MPFSPLHKCNHPACTQSTDKRFCAAHNSVKDEHDSLYTTYRWTKARKSFLRANQWCACMAAECKHDVIVGCLDQSSAVVDHVVPRTKGGATWDQGNWQRLCKTCHDRKTNRENRPHVFY